MNSTNETYYPLEFWFEAFGIPKYLDLISAYIILPIGLISFLLNVLAFIVLRKQSFQKSLFFSYMKLYILNGAILSLICSTTFIFIAQKIFSFSNTYYADAYGAYVFTPVQTMFFLYTSLLEICILIERLLYFLPSRFRKIQNINFIKLNLFLVLFCIILHIPSIFFFVPAFVDVQLDRNTSYRIWYAGITDFSNTFIGQLFNYLQYLIRDILPLILKIILNSMLVYLVKSYLNKLKKEKFANAQKFFKTRNDSVNVNIHNENYISKTDRNQTYISLIMCIFSIFEHIFYIGSIILYFLNEFTISNILFCLASLFIAFKHMFNILVLYKFNTLFKIELKKFLKIII